MLTVAERVQNGVNYLNKYYGRDWIGKINMGEFNIREGCCCIGAQLCEKDFCTFEDKFEEDTDNEENIDDYGFTSYNLEWGELQQEWEKQINLLRGE